MFLEKMRNETEEQKNIRHEHELRRIKTWLLKGGNNFFHSDLVLVPVNTHNTHWTMVVIDNRKHTITYYDSMKSVKRADEVFAIFE